MKKALSVIICALMLLSLAACTGNTPAVDPTEAPTDGPVATAEPTEAPAETEAPDPGVFVPEGYDAHDYLALAKFFSTAVDEDGTTIGDLCYDDYSAGEFDLNDPATWRTDYHGVKWDAEGKVTEITFYPPVRDLPAALELVGFEHLKTVWMVNTSVDSVLIEDCPALDGDSMVYVYSSGNVSVTAGYIETLWAESRTEVFCSLKNENGDPFTLVLTAAGPGAVVAHAALDEGVYELRAYAQADEYIEFTGWVDEDGNTVSTETSLTVAGAEVGPFTGVRSELAVFGSPDAPSPLPDGDYFCEIKPDVAAKVDIDGDGENDTVLVKVGKEAPDGNKLSVSITLAAKPDAPYEFDAGEGHSLFAAAVDMDTSDKHIEVLLCYDMCDGDPITYVFRLKDDGSDFDVFTDEIDLGLGAWSFNGVDEDYIYSAEDGIPFSIRTEILGTYFVFNHFTVTKDGIEYLSDEFTYGFAYTMKLVKELTVTLENGKTVTVPVGAKITPYSTDRATFVKVKLEDGSIGRVEVTFGDPDYHFPVLLNGVQQDEYFDMIPYAD